MGDMAEENLKLAMHCFTDGDREKIDRVYATEKYIDYLTHEITNYMVDVNQQQLPVSDSLKIAGLFHVVSDIERIGDHAENIVDAAVQIQEQGIEFSKKALKELHEMFEKDMRIITLSLEMFDSENKEHLDEILALEEDIDRMEKELHNSHIRRMSKGKCSPESGLIYTDLVTGLERVADHATNIAFSMVDMDSM